MKKLITVWFSCGAASAVAAKKTIEKYGQTHDILIVNNPIKEEHEDNRRFLKQIEEYIQHPIIEAVNSKFPNHSIVEVFDKKKYMSGVLGAPCTLELKKEARYQFELSHNIDFHVLGFTIDEWQRQKKFNEGERGNTLPVLIENFITKDDCFKRLRKDAIKIPEIYNIGFPNANCIGCVKAQSPTYWNLVRSEFPLIFQQRAEQSRRIGCKLVKLHGKRIFLDELKPSDKGGKIRNWECGIFCSMGEI
ncbi:MAG: hypothetical protein M0R37_13005 [Bacteroidales bacterium]|nr:hypothetical protein [Bacteroidales bacterium]